MAATTRRRGARLALAVATVAVLATLAASVPVTGPDEAPTTANGTATAPEPPQRQAPELPFDARGALALAAVVVTVVGVAAAAARRALRGEDVDEASPASGDGATEPDLDAVAEAAARAARRLERSDPDAFENEVYHAWRAMTVALGADGDETRTPGEFADLAVAAGMGSDDVAELTRLFARVRYGGATATPELEQRATDLLWRIDRTYRDA